MKRFITFACLLAALSTTGGLQRGLTDSRFDQLAEDNISAPLTTSDMTPMFCVRFDDGRNDQIVGNEVRQFLKLGIPVTLSLNSTPIDASGGAYPAPRGDSSTIMSWQDIRDLMSLADSLGVPIEIANHSKNNLNGNSPYDGTFNYDDLVDELSNDRIIAELGVQPKVYIQPGDSRANHFTRRYPGVMQAILDSLGYDYADLSYGASDTMPYMNWVFNSASQTAINNPEARGSRSHSFPGMAPSRYEIPGTITIDLGSYVIERSDWTMYGENGGVDVTGLWSKPLWKKLAVALANGSGFCMAMHDSVDTDAIAIEIGHSSDPSTHAGHFSPYHLAVRLAALRDAGLIQLGTYSQYAAWNRSKPAPGTDLLAYNSECELPQFAVADTFGIQYGWIAGHGSFGAAGADWSSGVWTVNYSENLTQGKLWGDVTPGGAVGSAVVPNGPTIKGWGGRAGGIKMTSGSWYFGRTQLPPGRYRFQYTMGGSQSSIYMRDFILSMAAQYSRLLGGWANYGTAYAFGDTQVTLYSDTINSTGAGARKQLTAPMLNLPKALMTEKQITFGFPPNPIQDTPGFFYNETGVTTRGDPILYGKWYGGVTIRHQVNSTSDVYGSPKLIYLGDY